MKIPNTIILCSMRIILIIYFYLDLAEWKTGFCDKIFDFKIQFSIFDLFKFVKVNSKIRINSLNENCVSNYEN